MDGFSLTNYNLIFLFVLNAVSLWISMGVYSMDRKARVNQLFFFIIICIIVWTDFNYLGDIVTQPQLSLVLKRIYLSLVSLFFIFAYFFSIYFPTVFKKRHFYFEKITIIILTLISFLTVFTDLIVKNVEKKEWGADIASGNAIYIFYLLVTFYILLILFNLIRKYFILSASDKLKLQYFLVGVIFYALFQFTFNVVYPIIFKTKQYWNLGDYSAIFLLGFTAYAIVRRELFGIKVILTEVLVGAIAIILLVQIFVSQSIFEYIWKSGLLALFLIFGYLLIKSILGEVKRREELERLTLEVEASHVKLAAAYKSLEKLDIAKTEFISMASHQLRTPLSAIKGYISMLLEDSYGKIPSKAKEKLENVFQSNERLIRLVNDLLNISKIELGKMELEKEKTNIENLIQSCYQEMKIATEKKGLNFVFKKPEPPLPEIAIDALKIRQAILNLIDNAIKYTTKGEIVINAKKTDSHVLISVKDTGAGLIKKEQEEIFAGFARGSAGITHFVEGTGLGLYIAKKYLELHRGKIWVESEGKEKGATFFVELPIE